MPTHTRNVRFCKYVNRYNKHVCIASLSDCFHMYCTCVQRKYSPNTQHSRCVKPYKGIERNLEGLHEHVLYSVTLDSSHGDSTHTYIQYYVCIYTLSQYSEPGYIVQHHSRAPYRC